MGKSDDRSRANPKNRNEVESLRYIRKPVCPAFIAMLLFTHMLNIIIKLKKALIIVTRA